MTTDARALAAPVDDRDPHSWWRTSVVYQIYPRSFADSNGDGVGDLRGIIEHLDHLVDLGIDVVWLSPIYASPHADNGYDISDYRAIDPVFGTLDDFDELVEALHLRGMRLVMDLVVNHTSDEHPWFVESASGPDSPKRDWYWWRPPRAGRIGGSPGAEPNNWGSFFSGPAWTYDEASGEYYLHLFARKQPDLNWENREVRAAVHDVMRWWIDRGVDGFRMDVINLISKHPDLPDGPVRSGGAYGDGFPHYNCGPRLHEFLQEMHEHVLEGHPSHLLTIGEMPGVTIDQARLATDPARRELDMVFQFEHVSLDHGPTGKWEPTRTSIDRVFDTLVEWQEGLAAAGWNGLYWNNHDQPRVVSRFGNDREHWHASATALATVLHMQRGTPFVYQGEELGMTNMPFSDMAELRDIESLNHIAEAVARGAELDGVLAAIRWSGRDNARTPMQWTHGPHAGFTTAEPWIGVNPNHDRINAHDQRGVPGSVFEHYRALIALRRTDRVVSDGTFARLTTTDPLVVAFERRLGDESLLVVANLSDVPRHAVEAPADAVLVLRNVLGPVTNLLAPWEARVHRIRP
ncbi:alpha-glucosidase [Microbacterium immunditiarum]|uniref:Oligo-1,6-glucosidase n=1 Tax=Microbacterium immunditiarum TaxID=337480 RepID=A0A7Y9GKH6_9MICO|nr:alpha-glucosidase [Microbacterium immunditiarum]NYE18196.1 oligo-1,6-glucosidase [Microbacterium immunditiarum]